LATKAVVNGNVHYALIEMVMGAEVNGSLVHGQPEKPVIESLPDAPVPMAPKPMVEVNPAAEVAPPKKQTPPKSPVKQEPVAARSEQPTRTEQPTRMEQPSRSEPPATQTAGSAVPKSRTPDAQDRQQAADAAGRAVFNLGIDPKGVASAKNEEDPIPAPKSPAK
jgi:hypothetical protein